MYEEPKDFLLVYISGSEIEIFTLKLLGSEVRVDRQLRKTIKLQKSQKKGGQSAARIGRLHDEAHHNYITLMAEKVRDAAEGKSVVVAGPAEKKHRLVEELTQQHALRVLGTVTCASSGELLEKHLPDVKELLQEVEFAEENALLRDFCDPRNSDRIALGKREVNQFLSEGRLETVYIHQARLDDGSVNREKLEEKCAESGAVVRVFQTPYGLFRDEYGGIGGTLRY